MSLKVIPIGPWVQILRGGKVLERFDSMCPGAVEGKVYLSLGEGEGEMVLEIAREKVEDVIHGLCVARRMHDDEWRPGSLTDEPLILLFDANSLGHKGGLWPIDLGQRESARERMRELDKRVPVNSHGYVAGIVSVDREYCWDYECYGPMSWHEFMSSLDEARIPKDRSAGV